MSEDLDKMFSATAKEYHRQLHQIDTEISRLTLLRARIAKILQVAGGDAPATEYGKRRTTPRSIGLVDAIMPLLDEMGVAPGVHLTVTERRDLLEKLTDRLLSDGFAFLHDSPIRSTSIALRHALDRRKKEDE